MLMNDKEIIIWRLSVTNRFVISFVLLDTLETYLTSNFKKQEFKTRFKTFEYLLPPIFILKRKGRKFLEITKPRPYNEIVSNEVEILSYSWIELENAKPFKIDVYLILYECIYNQCVLSHDKKDSDAMRNNK